MHCFNLHFFFSLVLHPLFSLRTCVPAAVNIYSSCSAVTHPSVISFSFIFFLYSVLRASIYLHTEMCIPGRDKTSSRQHTGSDLPNLHVLRTEEYSCEKCTPLCPYLDLSSVAACRIICGVIYQMLTKGWYAQWCLSGCGMFCRNPSKHCL